MINIKWPVVIHYMLCTTLSGSEIKLGLNEPEVTICDHTLTDKFILAILSKKSLFHDGEREISMWQLPYQLPR